MTNDTRVPGTQAILVEAGLHKPLMQIHAETLLAEEPPTACGVGDPLRMAQRKVQR